MKKTNFWVLNEFWTKAFFISHITGWIIAWAQTVWIVWEVRQMAKGKKK